MGLLVPEPLYWFQNRSRNVAVLGRSPHPSEKKIFLKGMTLTRQSIPIAKVFPLSPSQPQHHSKALGQEMIFFPLENFVARWHYEIDYEYIWMSYWSVEEDRAPAESQWTICEYPLWTSCQHRSLPWDQKLWNFIGFISPFGQKEKGLHYLRLWGKVKLELDRAQMIIKSSHWQ